MYNATARADPCGIALKPSFDAFQSYAPTSLHTGHCARRAAFAEGHHFIFPLTNNTIITIQGYDALSVPTRCIERGASTF